LAAANYSAIGELEEAAKFREMGFSLLSFGF
jgi:hypothetical protein